MDEDFRQIVETNMRQLHGRIVALEMVCQGLLTIHLSENFADPLDAVGRARHAMVSSAQNLERPEGDYEDAVWAEAFESLDQIFANVRSRLQTNLGQG